MIWSGFLGGICATAAAAPAEAAPAESGDSAALWSKSCRPKAGVRFLLAPRISFGGQRLRVLVVAERPIKGARLTGRGPRGLHALKVKSAGGPPFSYYAEIDRAAAGRHRFRLTGPDGAVLACVTRRVRSRRARPRAKLRRNPREDGEDIWPIRRSWNRPMENLYGAWIAHLFDAASGVRPSWTPLHQVLRDPERNLLYNYLGRDEDGPSARHAVVIKPDCADLPYFLRAYFAWKLGLPMGYRHCNRGSSKRYARCGELRTNKEQVLLKSGESVGRGISRFFRRKLSYVHSGSARTGPRDDDSDLFPVALTRRALRPGAVYVDPYGHLLVIAKWIPQQPGKGGLLYAVDGHPDLSVGRKRFWKGAFLFTNAIKGGGFKAFRPLVLKDGEPRPLTNDELKKHRDYRGMYSPAQAKMSVEHFYRAMDKVVNPTPLLPQVAYRARLKALFELIQERVDSVQAGKRYMAKTGSAVIPMPRGPRIFETRGAWENFSTPARDMRLLIAIHDVASFPKRLIGGQARVRMDPAMDPQGIAKELERISKAFVRSHFITYEKSDGSQQRLTMADILARSKALEVAYNPNDCIELRWGATGEELRSCKARAPQVQQALMARFRPWFATRNRPPIR